MKNDRELMFEMLADMDAMEGITPEDARKVIEALRDNGELPKDIVEKYKRLKAGN